MQGNAVLHRYHLNSQSSEAITAVKAQGKLRYADSLLYIMHDSKIEVLAHTDTTLANIEKSTLNAAASFRYSGISSSSAIGMHGSFTYGYNGDTYYRCLAKQYELKDHLGNVRVVISDVKEPNANYDQFTATLQSYANYYAFGMLQPNRHYTLAEEYKFGFNGMEVEDDISGDNNHLVFTYRIHDARLGRFMSVDPLFSGYPWNSAYSFAENDVIRCIDLEGAERFVAIVSENNTGSQTTTMIEIPDENVTKEGILFVVYKGNNVSFYFQSFEEDIQTLEQFFPEKTVKYKKGEKKEKPAPFGCNTNTSNGGKRRKATRFDEWALRNFDQDEIIRLGQIFGHNSADPTNNNTVWTTSKGDLKGDEAGVEPVEENDTIDIIKHVAYYEDPSIRGKSTRTEKDSVLRGSPESKKILNQPDTTKTIINK